MQRRLLSRVIIGLEPEPHTGLGLDVYARTTSPLRRYADLVVHQQLRAFVLGQPVLNADRVLERTANLEAAGALIRRAERLSNLHWKLVYLARRPDWRGQGVVVSVEERKAIVMIPELALETPIRPGGDIAPGQALELAVREVDVPGQSAYFRVSSQP